MQRVGGDTNALELEEENFELKKQLIEKERALAEQGEVYAEIQSKYEKTFLNLQKMDAAWKASIVKVQDLQEKLEEGQKQMITIESLGKAIQVNEEKIQQLQRRVSQLQEEVTSKDISNQELQGQVEIWKKQCEEVSHQMHLQTDANQDVQREFEGELQQAIEKAAQLQGDVNVLRESARHHEKQFSALNSKLFLLKEENASLSLQCSSSKVNLEHQISQCDFLNGEIERLQKEKNERDYKLLQLEQKLVEYEKIHDKSKKKLQLDEHTREIQAKQLEMELEKKWRNHSDSLEHIIHQRDTEILDQQSQIKVLLEWQRSMYDILGVQEADGAIEKLKLEVTQRPALLLTVQNLREKLRAAEKSCEELNRLQSEYASLETQHLKTREAMERIVGRKQKKMEKENKPSQKSIKLPETLTIKPPLKIAGSSALKPPKDVLPYSELKRKMDEISSVEMKTPRPKVNHVVVASRYMGPQTK